MPYPCWLKPILVAKASITSSLVLWATDALAAELLELLVAAAVFALVAEEVALELVVELLDSAAAILLRRLW